MIRFETDNFGAIVVFIVGRAIYVLLGSFGAWLLGVPNGTLAWWAVVLLWPMVGALLFFGCVAAVSAIAALIVAARRG